MNNNSNNLFRFSKTDGIQIKNLKSYLVYVSFLISRESVMEKSSTFPSAWGSPMQNETIDLQVDYWPTGSTNQTSKKEEKKEQNKVPFLFYIMLITFGFIKHS